MTGGGGCRRLSVRDDSSGQRGAWKRAGRVPGDGQDGESRIARTARKESAV
ncbi:hypothetical protein BDQ17DRAFT_1343080, partial [Cyathus striatus]